MIVAFVFLFIAAYSLTSASNETKPQGKREQAQALADVGRNELYLFRLSEAQTNCDAALKVDTANATAKECLDQVSAMLVDQDLNEASSKVLNGERKGAIALASKWLYAAPRSEEKSRASEILQRARHVSFQDRFIALSPEWLRQVLLTILILTFGMLLLVIARRLRTVWKRSKWYGDISTTKWSMLPIRELTAAAGGQTGIATDTILDALARLGHELEREIWQPKLLLLRPTPPADYEPAIISDFLSSSLPSLVLVPAPKDIRLEWQLHEVQLHQAVQNLQLKAAAGIDIGSVARFIGSILEWLNTGAPVISGVAQITDKSASIHLTARGGRVKSVAVTASTDTAPGIDPTQLSAERAAFKFLLRMRYPGMTTDEIDGFSALRQGASQFAQYAGTVPGVGDDANTRRSSLAHAAFNFGFFRASIPIHCAPPPGSVQATSLDVTDDVRQATLLAEGVAHSLVGGEQDRMSAIDCFRQLQDWPGSAETEPLRQQAAYDEAIVWGQQGYPGRCALMLTELLGQRAPDTLVPGTGIPTPSRSAKQVLPDAIRFPARLVRLAAFAKYTRDDWQALPESRAKLIIDDAEMLIKELDSLGDQHNSTARDLRLARYMYIEALRALGHVELLRVITGSAASLYHDGRPTGRRQSALNEEGTSKLKRAISWMLLCEELSPSCDLFCDLAEAYLLLRDFTAAEGYARHATLESNPYHERAYYIATESFYLENTDRSKALAQKYARDFKGTVSLEEFKSVQADLGVWQRS